MTDKEIITALGFCSDDEAACDLCPYYPHSERVMCCSTNMMRDTLRLITCQKSQIEDLSEALEERMEIINALIAGQETLQKYIDTTQTAAIREFAERLKILLTPYPDCDFKEPVTSKQIDTLVKEMTEDTDNE